MRRLIPVLTAIVVLLTPFPGVRADDASDFAKANALYEQGDYEGAAKGYSAIVERGVVDADLFYNLGNAHYKLGNLGYAILYLERARRLSPRDNDIIHNLGLARSLLRDSQFVTSHGRLRRWTTMLYSHLSTSESFVLATALYLLLCVAVVAFIFRRTSVVSRIYGRISVLSPGRLFGFEKRADLALAVGILFLLTSSVGASAWAKQNEERTRREAVIVVEEVPVFSGPSEDSTLQFKVHEGTIVDVDDARTGWLDIELPGELSGWIRSGTAERI